MGLVEQDEAIEVRSAPVDDLLQSRAPATGAAQCRVGGKQDALFELDLPIGFEAGDRLDVRGDPAQGLPVSEGITLQRRVFAQPYVAPVSTKPLVHEQAGELTPLAGSCAITEEEALAVDIAIGIRDEVEALFGHRVAAGQIVFVRFQRVDDGLELRSRKDALFDDPSGQPRNRRGAGRLTDAMAADSTSGEGCSQAPVIKIRCERHGA
jgi:hypothetical protein